MKCKYRLFQRNNGIFFIQNNATGRQESLRTRDKEAARRIFNAKNEAHQQPAINLQIARAYLMASDPLIVRRTWQHVMDEVIKTKQGSTQERWQRAIKDKVLDSIRSLPLIETQAEQLFRVLEKGTVSTNVHLRKLHNFCLAMNWLPWPTIPKKQWPPVQFKEKRAITWEEHCRIVEREKNPERKKFYELCWHLGGTLLLRVAKKLPSSNDAARAFTYSKRTEVSEFRPGPWEIIPHDVWRKLRDNKFLLTRAGVSMAQKIAANCRRTFDSLVEMRRGDLPVHAPFDEASVCGRRAGEVECRRSDGGNGAGAQCRRRAADGSRR